MHLVIVSGRSGSGKSTALDFLEDNDFYCIDNLPASLFVSVIDRALKQVEITHHKIAVSIDARSIPSQIEKFPAIFKDLNSKHIKCHLVYLDARDDQLLKRFSETRRRHPLATNAKSLSEALQDEAKLLKPIVDLASVFIDTTSLNLYQLKDMLRLRLLDEPDSGTTFFIESFGFKKGISLETDFMFDLRCLPNPYWIPELRALNGRDKAVEAYFNQQADVQEMKQDILDFLTKWLPRFVGNNRSYVTIGIGCTGGQHRSVYMVEQISQALKPLLKNIQIRHRDLS